MIGFDSLANSSEELIVNHIWKIPGYIITTDVNGVITGSYYCIIDITEQLYQWQAQGAGKNVDAFNKTFFSHY